MECRGNPEPRQFKGKRYPVLFPLMVFVKQIFPCFHSSPPILAFTASTSADCLSGRLPEVIRDMVVNGMQWKEAAAKYAVSEAMLTKYRRKALSELAALYEAGLSLTFPTAQNVAVPVFILCKTIHQ